MPKIFLPVSRFLSIVFFTVGVVYVNAIYAHAKFMVDSATPPRYDSASIKTSPPCGSDAQFSSIRTHRKAIFQTGETITVNWVETVEHGGSYVFDFSLSPEQGFDTNVLDIVPDEQNDRASIPHHYSHDITLDFPACDSCTLRMRQDMENAQNYYYSCADVVIVSGSDVTPPADVRATSASVSADTVVLSWINPLDYKAILVLKNKQAITDTPADRNDYLIGDMIGASQVIYKGTAASFVDNALDAETAYTYKIFAYDADYNYNAGVTQVAVTNRSPDDIGGGTGGEGTTGGGGAIFGMLLLLLRRGYRQYIVKK
ncbi:MAG: lytic polysaccharide monooxygenase [Gammaproteobacteria bacterium]|nr:lytic polysaccharide monooxygenase [Gammaproteobacteria bacterium]